MRVLAEAMMVDNVVPNACCPIRMEDDTNAIQHSSMVLCVSGAEEDETLDGVWRMDGMVRLYIKEVSSVRDEVRRGWMAEVEEWFEEAGLLVSVNAMDDCVQFFQLESSGGIEWNEVDRSIWGEVSWKAVVEV